MNRTFDIRILAFGLLLGLALLVRPIDTANASHEVTGSTPAPQTRADDR